MRLVLTVVLLPCLLLSALPARSQSTNGETLFQTHCAECHLNPTSKEIPTIDALSVYEPNAILMALTDGVMRLQGAPLSDADRIAVTEYLTNRKVVLQPTEFRTGMCSHKAVMATPDTTTAWNGWGAWTSNWRYQTGKAGLQLKDIAKLKLKWAFGIPNASQSRSQPAIAGGLLFMGSQSGYVYALDAASGCSYWSFKAGAGVRTAISVGPFVT